MALTSKQETWLKTAQAGAADFEKEAATLESKGNKLGKTIAELDKDKDTIKEAQNFEVTLARNPGIFQLPGSGKTMPWMTGNMETEVDTRADIRGTTEEISGETIKKLYSSFDKILARQQEMLEAKDGDGNQMFTEEDITRELWTPLVREGIIPANIVPARYSQFEKMFRGASDIYEKKLAEHSEDASKHEVALEFIGVGRDVISLAGKLGSEIITAVDFESETSTLASDREIYAKQEVLANQKDNLLENMRKKLDLPTNSDSADILKKAEEAGNFSGDIQSYNNITDATNTLTASLVGNSRWVAEKRALLTASTSLIDAGLRTAEKGVVFSEKKEKTLKDKLEFAQSAGETIGDQIKNALAAAGASDRVRSDDGAEKENIQGFKSAIGVVDIAIKGSRIGEKVLQATNAATFKEKEKAVMSIVGSIADTLAATAIAGKQANGDVSTGKDDVASTNADESKKKAYGSGNPGDTGDPSALLAESIKAAFIVGADAWGAIKALKNKDYKAFGKALTLGLAEVATASAAGGGFKRVLQPDLDLVPEEDKANYENLQPQELLDQKLEMSGSKFSASSREKFLTKFSDADFLKDVNEQIQGMMNDLDALSGDPKATAEVKKNTAAAVQKLESEKTKNALDEFKQKLADPKERKAYIDQLEKEAEEEHKALKELIEEASEPDDPNDEEAVKKSLKAVDILIKDIRASQVKIKMIETIATGGVKVLTSIFPVTGLAENLRKLTLDAIALAKKSREVDQWRKNVNLAEASNSVYFHAIKERYNEAAIQVSQKTLNTFFSIVGTASEIARLADATQVSTGMAMGMNMGKALADFGYKTYGRTKIAYGWKKYVEARKDPANRKAARAAIAGNPTLAKCVLAYGIVEDRDPIARQVGRNCGLTPEVLASNTDVCSAVVKYFETLYSDDPVVLRRVPRVENWHPCTPDLSLKSWLLLKKAATTHAYPRMSEDSMLTPNIDKALKDLYKLCEGDPLKYPEARDKQLKKPKGIEALVTFAKEVDKTLASLQTALRGYKPVASKPDDPETQKWVAGQRHHEMENVADAMDAQAELLRREIANDLKIYDKQAA